MVRSTDPLEKRPVRLFVEVAHGVGAQKGEGVLLGQIVPELFDADGCLHLTVTPKEVDHLAIGTNGPAGP